MKTTLRHIYLCRTANMSWRTCVVVKQIQSNPIQRPPIVRIGNTLLPVEESTKFLGLWWDSHLSFKRHISVLKTQCKVALSLIRVVAHLKWGGDTHELIEGVSKCMISGQEAQAKLNEYHEAQGSNDADGSKMNEKVLAAAVINHHFQNGETTCRQLSKGLPDNSTIFAAEATAISLALNYYQHIDPVHHDVVVYSDSMSCLQAIEGEDYCLIKNNYHWSKYPKKLQPINTHSIFVGP